MSTTHAGQLRGATFVTGAVFPPGAVASVSAWAHRRVGHIVPIELSAYRERMLGRDIA
jgi:hypothetical protein